MEAWLCKGQETKQSQKVPTIPSRDSAFVSVPQ